MPVVPGGTPWNPSLHPRQTGGRFGQSSNTAASKQESQLGRQLRERASDDRKRAADIEQQIRSIQQQIASLRKSTTHSTQAHSSKAKSARGAKSGTAKKTSTKSKTSTKTSTKTSAATSTAQKIANMHGKIMVLRAQRNALLKDATKMENQAARL